MNLIRMKRNRAAKMLDDIRANIARGHTAEQITEFLRKQYGIEPLERCSGEAHSNPHIYNCSTCAPRWGVVGKKIQIT